MTGKKIGRPRKGERDTINIRPPKSWNTAERMKDAGYATLNQFLVDELAKAWGYEPLGPDGLKDQEALPYSA